MTDKPDCYKCPGDCHSGCANRAANVTANPAGVRRGWFSWPYNFDPVWLVSCDGFEAKDTLAPSESHP
jgi:hypothetical protein